jgi:hypothetical protein
MSDRDAGRPHLDEQDIGMLGLSIVRFHQHSPAEAG